MIPCRFESCTESSTSNSFIHPPIQSVSTHAAKSVARGSEEDLWCRHKLRFFAPADGAR
jgi:hypothetical protein